MLFICFYIYNRQKIFTSNIEGLIVNAHLNDKKNMNSSNTSNVSIYLCDKYLKKKKDFPT